MVNNIILVYIVIIKLAYAQMSVPGLDLLGIGFNGITMEPTGVSIISQIRPSNFSTTCYDSSAQCGFDYNCWFLKGYSNETFMLTENTCVSIIDASMEVALTQVMTNSSEYSSYYDKITKKKHHRKTTTTEQKHFVEDSVQMFRLYSYVLRSKLLYSVHFLSSILPWEFPVNSYTQSVLNNLPANYSSNRNSPEFQAYRNAILSLGTDFIYSVDLGGSQMMLNRFYQCLLDQYSSDWVSQMTKKNYFIVTKVSGWQQYVQEIDKFFLNTTNVRIEYKGGSPYFYSPDQWDQWVASIRFNPAPITYDLQPISSLISDKQKSLQYELAVGDYEKEMNTGLSDYESQLKPFDPSFNPCKQG